MVIATSFAQDVCHQFSPSEQSDITSTCGAAVDYSFFLPKSSTLSSLEKAARSALGSNEFLLVSSKCLVDYKKLICGSIYLKCHPGVNLSDVTSFNNNLYPLSSGPSVPFMRPCLQVCHYISFKFQWTLHRRKCVWRRILIIAQVCRKVAESCLGIIIPNCSAEFDYSFGRNQTSFQPQQYDTSNDVSQCNNVPALFQVAEHSEPYIFKKNGACSGLISEVFIPPGTIISPSYSYLTAPYAIQNILEKTLKEIFLELPDKISEKCFSTVKKYFCESYL